MGDRLDAAIRDERKAVREYGGMMKRSKGRKRRVLARIRGQERVHARSLRRLKRSSRASTRRR